jgi:hypothetical protein
VENPSLLLLARTPKSSHLQRLATLDPAAQRLDANLPAQALELHESLIVQGKGAIYADSEIGGTCGLAYFLVSGSLSRPCRPRNSFLPSENVTLLPTARVV